VIRARNCINSQIMRSPLLSLRSASVRLGPTPLFAALTAAVGQGDRICLVGRNGAGKSTLLKALAGLVELDAGERLQAAGSAVAYLPQEPELEPRLSALEATLGGMAGPAEPELYAHRAAAALDRFGIDPARRIAELSGGEARRVDLARVLISEPDVLLLDEPTNHLDLPTIERLEEQLGERRGGLVMVSHDRAFLTTVSRTVWWLDRGRLRVLERGFDEFEAWSEQVLAEEAVRFAKLERTIEVETEWSHHGITARRRRNQGRLRRLQALRAGRARRQAPEGSVKLGAASAPASGRLVIEAQVISKSLGDRPLVRDFSTRIMRGDRVGIVGPNGCGKTTLLSLLTGSLAPDAGTVRLGTGLAISFIDQRREALDQDATPWQMLCPAGGDQVSVHGRPQHVIGYLREFLFRPEQARTTIRALSGGERNRLLLAKELARPANLLVLDEPTNDLDMDTLDLLQEVLSDFAGTLLLVSHDRDFLDRLVTSVIAFEGGGRLREYAGGYRDMLRQRPAWSATAKAPATEKPRPAKLKNPATPLRARSRAQRDLDRLIGEIEALSAEVGRLEQELGDPDLFRRDPGTFHDLTARLDRARSELGTAEQRWLELASNLEQVSD
jgi:ATP-binding cassette subfamily F protein uup